ncbi:MAG: hypothetical protein NTY09_14610 [bacterium]|nr:hypothetical protein [bacterium]
MQTGRVRITQKKSRLPERRKNRRTNPFGKKLNGFFGGLIRYGAIFLIAVLMIGSFSSRRVSISEADRLASELSELKIERDQLQQDLDRFSDPEWRESYWKWRTMRHEPGEYYLDFIEPDIF